MVVTAYAKEEHFVERWPSTLQVSMLFTMQKYRFKQSIYYWFGNRIYGLYFEEI